MSAKGFKIEIKSARVPEDDDFHKPYIGHSNAKANDMFGGTFHQHIEADHPYMIRFRGTPAVKLSFGIKDAEKNSAFRISFCVGKGNRLVDNKVLHQRAVFNNQIGTCTTGRLSDKCKIQMSQTMQEHGVHCEDRSLWSLEGLNRANTCIFTLSRIVNKLPKA